MEAALKVALVVVGLVLLGYSIRRLLMWMGDRGWIYYGNSPGSAGAGGLAAMEIASMLEPEVAHVVEEIRSEERRGSQDESGEGDDPDGGPV